MRPTRYVIDSNLLTLLVVGTEDRNMISRHRRLREYRLEDYAILRGLIENVREILVTPNTLTETSNLLGQHREPERSRLLRRLNVLIQESREVVVASIDASQSPLFDRLGLTDSVLLEIASPDAPLLTRDVGLYLAASRKGDGAAINFTYLRDL